MSKSNYILYDIEDAKKIIFENKADLNLYPLTPDTFNLVNGNYYLHIYDGVELIFNSILIINH